MYLKSLCISCKEKIIRNITFKYGLNIIVDSTPSGTDLTATGNNVGKTTVLKLVYFCFGGSPDSIYKDEDSNGEVFELVKNYLVSNNVLITLTLAEDLDQESAKTIVIKRSFGSPRILSINDEKCLVGDFESKLRNAIFPNLSSGKPTIKQLVGHNIRYKEKGLTNTLHYLNAYTSLEEYESLFLYMFGVNVENSEETLEINENLKKEKQYLARLEKESTLNQYKTKLAYVNNRINELTDEKEKLNINDNYENDINRVGYLKEMIGQLMSKKTNYKIKKDLIESSLAELETELQSVDLDEMRSFYEEMATFNPNMQKSFEEMLGFHNKMIENKKTFISRDLPEINSAISEIESQLTIFSDEQTSLINRINSSVSFETVKNIEIELYSCYEEKGKCDEMIQVIGQQQSVVSSLTQQLDEISGDIYSEDTQKMVQKRIDEFNVFFSNISNGLYGEKYLINYELKTSKKTGKKCYCFSTFNDNIGSGKKQGEILSFDLAYVEYAKKYKIPALFFLLNDKKELMHDNQLNAAFNYLQKNKTQLIVSMLRDKLPQSLNKNELFVLELSPNEKLFKIEQQLIEEKQQ